MNQWAFVIGAYALTLSGTGLISLFSWRAMRNAERRASAGRVSADRVSAGRA
ncbi:hypothetical protein K7W03_08725 [Sphingobium sp. PNB]|uniref:hypothetical protein n=1 Tax=Sphingobium sp. PNB TaxID=863934 RepID=UPI001CA3D724|nr:hypothetical protein [Sphingobium sp. PNB]MCB4859683.1 hypothetical protein [Sphingobium sp. PNB]